MGSVPCRALRVDRMKLAIAQQVEHFEVAEASTTPRVLLGLRRLRGHVGMEAMGATEAASRALDRRVRFGEGQPCACDARYAEGRVARSLRQDSAPARRA